MKLPPTIAEKLRLLQQGNTVPAAQMKHPVVTKMLEDGILQKQRTGSNRNLYFIAAQTDLQAYLGNQFGIVDLEAYIAGCRNDRLTRSEAADIASDSKLKAIRTFKGFLVNCYEPVAALLNGQAITIHPQPGTFQFIYDFESFVPATEVIIAGMENPENFRWIEKQQHLFEGNKMLFISRYPQTQSGDVLRWLKSIPNSYLHFGDFDFEGINIYLREYKKHLGGRAHYFIPPAIEELLAAKGNRDLYNAQWHHQPDNACIEEPGILQLLQQMHRYRKVLEQEALIRS